MALLLKKIGLSQQFHREFCIRGSAIPGMALYPGNDDDSEPLVSRDGHRLLAHQWGTVSIGAIAQLGPSSWASISDFHIVEIVKPRRLVVIKVISITNQDKSGDVTTIKGIRHIGFDSRVVFLVQDVVPSTQWRRLVVGVATYRGLHDDYAVQGVTGFFKSSRMDFGHFIENSVLYRSNGGSPTQEQIGRYRRRERNNIFFERTGSAAQQQEDIKSVFATIDRSDEVLLKDLEGDDPAVIHYFVREAAPGLPEHIHIKIVFFYPSMSGINQVHRARALDITRFVHDGLDGKVVFLLTDENRHPIPVFAERKSDRLLATTAKYNDDGSYRVGAFPSVDGTPISETNSQFSKFF